MANTDINDAFEDIFLCEDRLNEQGHQDGYEQGQKEGNPEGYHLGYHRGAELGAELGYYLGVAKEHLLRKNISEKINNNLKNLIHLIEEFPKVNIQDYDILDQADVIRSQYRKTCSLLKIDGKFPEAGNLSF